MWGSVPARLLMSLNAGLCPNDIINLFSLAALCHAGEVLNLAHILQPSSAQIRPPGLQKISVIKHGLDHV